MRRLRRLEPPPGDDPYRRALRGVIRNVALPEEAYRALVSDAPEAVVAAEDSILIAEPRDGAINLHYSFPDRDSFARDFERLLGRLIPALDPARSPLGIRFRLTDRSNRPFLEPVLVHQAFELTREWLEMRLAELPPSETLPGEVVPGYVIREARPEDAAAIVELDGAAFPTPALTPAVVVTAAREGQHLRLLEEQANGRPAGFLRLRTAGPGVGYIADLAVHPDSQRRGLGEAMLRWSLARLSDDGCRSARLTVNIDNTPAIALYRKLGFTPGERGLDYRRPIDEDEVRRIVEKRRGSLIRFRRR